jgi:hypothetical protein
MRMRASHCLLLLAIVALSRTAVAACLLSDYSVRGEYDRSAAVIAGEVIAQRPVAGSAPYLDGVVYTVKVEAVYRGDVPGSVEVFSENSSGRFPMERQRRYLLFVYREVVGRLQVDNCGNSGPIVEKADVLRAVEELARNRHGVQVPNSAPHADAACSSTGER